MKSYSDVIRDGWVNNVPPLDLEHLDNDYKRSSHQVSQDTTAGATGKNTETGRVNQKPVYFGKKTILSQTSPGR
jgi:hypothetical protein